MSKVLAKFKVGDISQYETVDSDGNFDGHVTSVKLTAVKDDIFGPHTPCGDISMTIHNDAAAKVFMDHMQDNFMVEFTPEKEYQGG